MSKNIVSNIPLAQDIIAICKTQNLKHIVISPGSRNAPLTISFSNDPFFKTYSIVDERCAAFFAMGIAQQTKEVVALVCTSGSALLNYYPAVTEAFYSDIPVVILSADRPKEFIDIGDGQTIRQEGVFSNHILYEANLENAENYTERLANDNKQKIFTAIKIANKLQGPVHINIPFYEPLYNTIIETINPIEFSFQEIEKATFQLDVFNINEWNKATKKLVLVGVLNPGEFNEKLLDKLMSDPSVVLFTETTSNLYHSKLIPSIDQLIAAFSEEEFQMLQPELLVTFGGLIVSKKIKAFLRKYQPKQHWHVNTKKAYDTFGCLTNHIETTPNNFFTVLFEATFTVVESVYQKIWLQEYKSRLKGHEHYLNEVEYSDLLVFEKIFKQFPQKVHLQLSNSSTIRYSQLFQLPENTEVFCNRGTSGIDGSMSTAIGAAIIQTKPSIFITGDLSFFYDSNALWNNYIPENFKIIVINNDGGGIFRILPGNKNTDYFATYLETTHNLKANQLAVMYGFNYSFSEKKEDLDQKLNQFFASNNKEILEIHTPRLVNDDVLLKYFKKIREYS